MEFLLQPNVYSTGTNNSLLSLLDDMWIKKHQSGDGTLYIISEFANYNGGVRFYPYFTKHILDGGKIKVILGGSSTQKLSSLKIVFVHCKKLLANDLLHRLLFDKEHLDHNKTLLSCYMERIPDIRFPLDLKTRSHYLSELPETTD